MEREHTTQGMGLRATGKWYRLVWSKGNAAAMVPERQFRRMDSREYKSAVVEYYSVVGVPGSRGRRVDGTDPLKAYTPLKIM